MFSKVGLIFFKAIKIYGISCIFFETYMNMFSSMEVDFSTLAYTFGIEGFFIFMKSAQVEIPMWVEAIQDVI